MRTLNRGVATAVAIGVVGALTLAGCSSPSSSSTSDAATKTLVVDKSFDLKTSDPARAFELTGSIVDKALYETALTFTGGDVSTPVPSLTTFEESSDNKVLTLTMNGKHTFSDGTPVTIDDIVFSYKRVQGIAGNPSFLLEGVDVEKTSDTTMTLTSKTANAALPSILPNPSLGVVNSALVKKNGGSETASDAAESFLNKTSAGSGPYILESYSVTTKVVFAPNTHYTGSKPAYGRVVLENVQGPTQKINVSAGSAQVALDLNSDQVSGLGSGSTKVIKGVSPDVLYSWWNQDSSVSDGVTDNADFLTAVRKGIDYSKILDLTGEGSTQPGGMVPSMFLGALKSDPSNTFDLAAAKAALAKSGYSGQAITYSYPNDLTINGLELQTIAEAVQSQLKTVGIELTLSPAPFATFIDSYRAGKLQAGVMYWGPDYPDPADYLVFSPGQSLGTRAGWAADADDSVAKLADAAATASGTDARVAAFEKWQTAMNASGPFVPIVQPGQYVVTSSDISSLELNAVWTVALAEIK